jgi:hypothetical protein
MSATDSDTTPGNAAHGGCSGVTCSSSSAYDDDYQFDDDDACHFCGGEGLVEGSELGDPGWYDPDQFYRCTCCGGSGKAEDCTFW